MTDIDPHPSDRPPTNNTGAIFFPIALALLFLSITLSAAYVKLLWRDEFAFFWIAPKPTDGSLTEFLAISGAPLLRLLEWCCIKLLGTGPIAVRLPSLLGMALALGCLWQLLARRTSPLCAAAGCLLLMALPAFDHAYDAGPYSLLLGFAAAAILCWSRSLETSGHPKALWLVIMTAALAGECLTIPPNWTDWAALPALGIAIGSAWLLARYLSFRRTISVVVLLCLCVLARQAACGVALVHQRHAFQRFEREIERAAAPGEPIVLGDTLAMMPLYWYGSPALRQEFVLPIDLGVPTLLQHPQEGIVIAPSAQEGAVIAPVMGSITAELAPSYEFREASPSIPWGRLQGVSTPLAYRNTRILIATPKTLQ